MTAARIVTVDIEALSPAGDGVATVGRLRVAVPFTIPGERVRIQLVAPQRGRATGRLVDIIRPSPHRVVPACRHFGPSAAGSGGCGGCSWQHISYAEQLRLKAAIVDRLVRAAVPDAPAARPMLAGTPIDDPWGYRNKVHFVFGHQQRRGAGERARLTMGHYARGSRKVIPVIECPVHDERGNAFAFAARDVYAAAFTGAISHGSLRSLAVRAGLHSDELMATLVVSDDRDRRVRAATRRVLETNPPTSMHLNVHAADDGFIFGRHTRRLHGPPRLREQVDGATFLMSPTAFFQTNVRAAEILVRLVVEALPTAARVLDLYAGCGLFAIPLSLAGHDVVAVEESREAVADGEAALALNPRARERCRFIARRVEEAVGSVSRADVVVLDPPREGCSSSVLKALVTHLRPSTIVYVSCNPETLAVELGVICRNGYQICALQPLDMFPHSAHIETVAVLSAALTSK